MVENVLFCFTGTGNSLKVAKDIADRLGSCEILPMQAAPMAFDLGSCKRVGFVFPVYFAGLPLQVERFIEGLQVPEDFDGYLFAVATYANFAGDALRETEALLRAKGHRLAYAAVMRMGDNAIAYYDSHPNMEKLAERYRTRLPGLLDEVEAMEKHAPARLWQPLKLYRDRQVGRVNGRDKGFSVSGGCTRCGLCARACPAGNIVCGAAGVEFCGRCEQCMACIQLCPKQAIDYRGKCGGRQRYRHPEVGVGEICGLNGAG